MQKTIAVLEASWALRHLGTAELKLRALNISLANFGGVGGCSGYGTEQMQRF